jgi:hypothetical protein
VAVAALGARGCAAAPGVDARPASGSESAPFPTVATTQLPVDASIVEVAVTNDADSADGDVPDRPDAADGDASEAHAAVALTIERPYNTWARPRPKGEVDAASADERLARWNVGGTSDPSYISNRPSFHPGTRVRVDARVVRGKLPKSAPFDRRKGTHVVVLSETSLLARSRKYGYWPFRNCFEAGLRVDHQLAGGETTLRFFVSTRGQISGSRLVRTTLRDPDVAKCLVDRARKIELLPPSQRVEIELDVQVWPGDAKLPLLDDPPQDALDLDADALGEVVEKDRNRIAACYQAGLERDPGLWGRIQVHTELEKTGKVRSARERESHFPDREVTRCVLEVVREMSFPAREHTGAAFELAFRLGRPSSDPGM